MAARVDFRRIERLAPAGAAACALILAAVVVLPASAWRAWLGAAFLWGSPPVGGLALLMIMRLTPGDWSEELGPFMEAQVLLLPLSALLILPVLIAAGGVYPWVHAPATTPFRAAYLSQPMFIARAVVWYVVLAILAVRLVLREDRSAATSSIGLIVLPVLATLIATDWLLSLDPGFASSGFGLYVLDIQMLTAFALAVIALVASGQPVKRPGIIGALFLCLLLTWSYFAFTHYVITWSGNLPPGVRWYQRRGGPWADVMWVVAASRIAPNFLLFFQSIRRSRVWLGRLAVAVVAGSVLETAWLVLPATAPPVTGVDVALFALANLAMAALVAGGFLYAFNRRTTRSPA